MAREDGFFDDLARGLASGNLTRGRALRLMGAALIGGTLTSFGIGGVAAADDDCKPTAKKCKKNKQCCSGNCSNGTCACKTYSSACNNNSECCSGYCNQFGVCDQNVVDCACQDGFMSTGWCTMAACGDTTALNQLCNSVCLAGDHGSGVASKCFLGGCGT